jgi:3-hydroxyisobutyrate dehydrogenase-like beta-hydroxyacid dehydrogenase
MKQIGFIGVGSIGAPMARCVIRAGFEVTVCDKNAQTIKEFDGKAARTTTDASACARNDMVIVMVANDKQVKDVILGKEGLLESIDAERPPIIAIMSTVLPQTVTDVASKCLKKGIRVVDAPVSGLPVVAERGELTIMVGGDSKDLDSSREVLKAMGKNIFHAGHLGSGEVTKLVNNIIGVTNIFLSVEAMRVGKHYAMDLKKMASILDMSSGRNFFTRDWDIGKATFAYFAQSSDLIKGVVDLGRKDLGHAQELAKKKNILCPLLDGISNAVGNFSYEEIERYWKDVIE